MKKTINGKEYTTFEPKKNAKELDIHTSRKFIVVEGDNYLKEGDIVTLKIDDGSYNPFFGKENKSDYHSIHWDFLSYYDEPLKNTIITDIKDEAQHKRVQEKLFEMGCRGVGTNSHPYGQIYIDRDNSVRSYCGNYITFPRSDYQIDTSITASEFLGEKVPTKLQGESGELDTGEQMVTIAPGTVREQTQIDRKAFITINKLFNYKIQTPNEPRVAKGNKIMSNIVNYFNDLTVSSEDKELRKAGLKDSDLNWTRDAKIIVADLEAKERGYKDSNDLRIKLGVDEGTMMFSGYEYEGLITKFYDKLLETAKKFNKKEDKKK